MRLLRGLLPLAQGAPRLQAWFSKALRIPARLIAENAGVDGSIVLSKLTEQKNGNFGFDAQHGEYGFRLASSIRPRSALQHAASVVGLMVTTEAMVAERPKMEAAPVGPLGGMGGGMGDMDY